MGSTVTAIYDEQCEICQAMVSWIHLLDPDGVVSCTPLDPERLGDLHPDLELEECLRLLHVVTNESDDDRGSDIGGESEGPVIHVAWDAVVAIARALPRAKPLVWLDRFGPTRRLASAGYLWLARNRYELSKCRGGACAIDRTAETKRRASMQVFWTCYNLGFLFRFPLIVAHALRTQVDHVVAHAQTYRRNVEMLEGKLQLLFLGGFPTDAVPLTFGERFTAIVYRGVLIDPGSLKMRASLQSHVEAGAVGPIRTVTATHHHEEHSGSLEWAAELVDARLEVAPAIAAKLRPPATIPLMRRFFIGQPPALGATAQPLGATLEADGTTLEVIPALGHCDDHVVFWDPEERVLLVGDTFMGAYFSSPNPDVDSNAWIATLERLISLKPEVMVEGHGHVHTLRTDIEDVPGVIHRQDPVAALTEKLTVLRWVREQVEAGLQEGLEVRAVEASCFPWGMAWSWENVVADETARLMTGGEFSRSELVRSFRRQETSALPDVLNLKLVTAAAPEAVLPIDRDRVAPPGT